MNLNFTCDYNKEFNYKSKQSYMKYLQTKRSRNTDT